jgi:hypothetical protein
MTVDSINLPPYTAISGGSVAITDPLLMANVDDIIDRCVYLAHIDHAVYNVHPMETAASTSPSHMVTNMDPDYEALHPYFGWLPFDMVKETALCKRSGV